MNKKQRDACSRLGREQEKVDRLERQLLNAKVRRAQELLRGDGTITRDIQGTITGKSVGWVQEEIRRQREKK